MPLLKERYEEYKLWVGAHALAFRRNFEDKERDIPGDEWRWIASGKQFPVDYKGWGKGEPDRLVRYYQYESCVALHHQGKLHDYFCKDRKYGLCQFVVE
jgi:hypothetical protein